MALSMIEIDKEDCGTDNHLEFIVMSQNHAQTLVGKYYQDPNSPRDWEELNLKTAISYINRKIRVRSPMTCVNPDFKICQKCFGTKKLDSKYVGIVAAQVITERLTQLTLRTFHESARATLPTDDDIVKFFEDHLIDLKTDETDTTTLTFDTENFPTKLLLTGKIAPIYGFHSVIENILIFKPDNWQIYNHDVISVVENVKKILRQGDVSDSVEEYYINLMSTLLEVGIVYSSFVEILFTNMFIVDKEKKLFWRYNQSRMPVFKLGDKMMAAYISSRIGLLYQPNKNTIEQVNLDELDTIDLENLTIYEKIFLGHV